MRAVRLSLAVVMALVALPAAARAETYTFDACMSSNYSGCSQLLTQMKVEVTDAGGGFVDFKFTNDATIASSITALYFDAAGYLTTLSIQTEVGVDFKTTNVTPPDAPSGDTYTPQFSVTANLSTDTTSPASQNGINSSGDYLVLRMGIDPSKSFADIINALNLGSETDALRIAAHVQGLPQGQSDTLICCTGTGISSPEPASLSLFGLMADTSTLPTLRLAFTPPRAAQVIAVASGHEALCLLALEELQQLAYIFTRRHR